MPTIFSHAVFAAVAGTALVKNKVPFWFWIIAALCAVLPDADVVTRSFGVERGAMLAHRGLTHSFFFALVCGSLVGVLVYQFMATGLSLAKLVVFFSLATLSHPLLDMLTDGGPGVALFAPFSGERFFFPWRPIEVSPIGFGFFSARGVEVIESEFIWIWFPALLIRVTAATLRRARASRETDEAERRRS